MFSGQPWRRACLLLQPSDQTGLDRNTTLQPLFQKFLEFGPIFRAQSFPGTLVWLTIARALLNSPHYSEYLLLDIARAGQKKYHSVFRRKVGGGIEGGPGGPLQGMDQAPRVRWYGEARPGETGGARQGALC